MAATAAETGLPSDDPVRFGGERAVARDRGRGRRLPWVTLADEARPTRDDVHLRLRTLQLPLRDPFVIARSSHGEGRSVTTVIVDAPRRRGRPDGPIGHRRGLPGRLLRRDARDDGRGRAAAARVDRADRRATSAATLDDVRAALEDAAGLMDRGDRATTARSSARSTSRSTTSSGKRLGVPVRTLLGVAGELPPTDFTLGIDEPSVVAERARRAADFPALKIKVGGPADLETLEAVRAVYGGPIRVDANTGWTPEEALALLPELERLGVELIEQPFPARRLDQLRWLQERSSLPIVADESAVTIEDLDALVGVVAGVNVKLAKCGGVGPGQADARARAGARVPDVPRLHGGDVDRDRRLRRRRAARRMGGPRRLPPPRRGPVRAASRSAPTNAGSSPTPRASGSSWTPPPRPDRRRSHRRRPFKGTWHGWTGRASTGWRRATRLSTDRHRLWTSRWERSWRSPFRRPCRARSIAGRGRRPR